MLVKRPSGRFQNELRDVSIQVNCNPYAEGSCIVYFGNTHVMCTATVDNKVPNFLRGKGTGWVTAEYGMLPRSTHRRMYRESANGKQSGRTQEIQRLIGRSLRAITDLAALGERQIIIDCDVLQADGGTRTAAITGGYVALHLALQRLMKENQISRIPLYGQVAAVSCGIYEGEPVLDLDYDEDSNADADANFVMTDSGMVVEIQGTAESAPFPQSQFTEMMGLATDGIKTLTDIQKKALKI